MVDSILQCHASQSNTNSLQFAKNGHDDEHINWLLTW